jgi:hypothetical protein
MPYLTARDLARRHAFTIYIDRQPQTATTLSAYLLPTITNHHYHRHHNQDMNSKQATKPFYFNFTKLSKTFSNRRYGGTFLTNIPRLWWADKIPHFLPHILLLLYLPSSFFLFPIDVLLPSHSPVDERPSAEIACCSTTDVVACTPNYFLDYPIHLIYTLSPSLAGKLQSTSSRGSAIVVHSTSSDTTDIPNFSCLQKTTVPTVVIFSYPLPFFSLFISCTLAKPTQPTLTRNLGHPFF